MFSLGLGKDFWLLVYDRVLKSWFGGASDTNSPYIIGSTPPPPPSLPVLGQQDQEQLCKIFKSTISLKSECVNVSHPTGEHSQSEIFLRSDPCRLYVQWIVPVERKSRVCDA